MSLNLSRSSSARLVRVLTSLMVVVVFSGCAHAPTATHQQVRSFPGVGITPTPAGGFSVRILSSLVGGGQPLYIVDGERVTVDPIRGIDWFQPEDIVRISVLKDPSETTVYGPSGVNGVILITTRHAMKIRR